MYVYRLLRAAILGESVMRGDSDNVAKVKEIFSSWSKLNARFAVRSILYQQTGSDIENSFLDTCVRSPSGGTICVYWQTLAQSLVDLPRCGLATADDHSDIFLLHCARSCDISFS